jgi:DNA invertase Pin-like site-specific DNA recombinase
VLGTSRIKPGTQMIRQWQNITHRVTASKQGFEWEGRTFNSLSAVAKAITGTNWNGFAFFGIKRAPASNKNAAGSRRVKLSTAADADTAPASTPKYMRTIDVRKPAPSPTRTFRCAIYTRKSSEEGLEQDFNSLHAQRESCDAYIKSQRHEGWIPLPALYDDSGYSGGSTDRPALIRLLADIQSHLIDVVVVYKVDRLTRSLADFAKIVEIFDAAGVSFVSVTQQFNTTTSMGRLTLNVLLSFAQFEREVTGERIRDKIAASKQKGMWMGGWVPIGYDRKDRTLSINENEARTVRTIFDLFLKLKNVARVQTELARLHLTTKPYATPRGRAVGGLSFARGHIYRILSNPLYIGEIEHRGVRYHRQLCQQSNPSRVAVA